MLELPNMENAAELAPWLVPMLQTYVAATGGELLGKVKDNVLNDAAGRIWKGIKGFFRGDAKAEKLLEDFQADPDAHAADLTAALETGLADGRGLVTELRPVLEEIRDLLGKAPQTSSSTATLGNVGSGASVNIVQNSPGTHIG